MSAAPHPARSSVAGFTLVEALVAMALTGLVLTGLALVTAQWLPNWQRGLNRVQQSELVALAIDRIVADLAAAEFVPANRESKRPLFEGSESSVTFVRTALGPNARPGLEIVRLAEAGSLQGPALVRSTATFAPRPPQAARPPFGGPTALLASPYRVSFSYAGRDAVWRSEWIDAEDLPRAVRLVVRDTANGRALGVSTTAVIHAELPAACVADQTRPGCGGLDGATKAGGGAGEGPQ